MPDEMFPIPEGMDQDRVMKNWQDYNDILNNSPNPQREMEELSEQHELFKTFRMIKESKADVVFSSDVDTPSDGSGVALALRVAGLTGQGLASLAGPLGVAAGAGIGMLGNAAANAVDTAQGRPTEAVPFSGLASDIMGVENPMTTGNPILDALSEGMIDAFTGAGIVSKAGVNLPRMMGKGGFSEYISKRLDPQFIEDLLELEGKHGLNVPIVLKERGIGGGVIESLSNIVSSKPEDLGLVNEVAKGLESTWKNAFKLDVDNPDVAEEVIAGFNSGTRIGKELKHVGGLLPQSREAIVNMAKFNRSRERLTRLRNGHRINFENSAPSISITQGTASTLSSAIKDLESINIMGDSQLNSVIKSIGKLRDNMVKPGSRTAIKNQKGTIYMHSAKENLLDSKTNPEAPFTILDLVDTIERKMADLGRLPESTQQDVSQQLFKVKESIETDIINSLSTKQKGLYGQYRQTSSMLNNTPQRILDNISAGEYTGFMETLISDRGAARQFLAQGVVTPQEAKSMLGGYLLDKGKKVGKDGSEMIDFVEIKKFIDNPKNREGVVELMGSDDLQLFRQFANVASNLSVTKGKGSPVRNALGVSALAGGSFLFFDPMAAAGSVAIAVSANQFLKNVLFNPKIGRQAIDMLKTPSNSAQGRKAFGAVMSALNGHEAAAIYMGNDGETLGEQQVVIRNREGGRPIFSPMD